MACQADGVSINSTLDPLRSELDRLDYLADEGLAMALFLAMRLSQPLLLEGPSGVGKSSAATALAAALRTPLIQLHCYEGSTADDALYRWNRPRQVLALRRAEATNDLPTDQAQDVSPAATPATSLDDRFTADFLIDGPLLRAVRHDDEVPAVLLIDDVDRSDARFEALLVEFLGQMSVTVPEIGTFGPKVPPIVIITCNGSRPLSDALKRGCHYHRMEHPSVERAVEIVRRRVGEAGLPLIEAATAFVFEVRTLDLDFPPGLAESIDWVAALTALGLVEFETNVARSTLGSIAKTPEDLEAIGSALDGLADSP